MRKLSFIDIILVTKNSVKHVQCFYAGKKKGAFRKTRNALGTKADRANVSSPFSSFHKIPRVFLQLDNNTYTPYFKMVAILIFFCLFDIELRLGVSRKYSVRDKLTVLNFNIFQIFTER